jgi:hypothetical protein
LSHFNGKAENLYLAESDVVPQYRIFKAPTSTFFIVCHVPQQYTEGTLLRFHGNNGYRGRAATIRYRHIAYLAG